MNLLKNIKKGKPFLLLIYIICFSITKGKAQGLTLSSILKDKKIALLNSKLPNGWSIIQKGNSHIYVQRKGDVLIPINAVKAVTRDIKLVKVKHQGKEEMMMKTNAYISFTIEKKWKEGEYKYLASSTAKQVYNSDSFTLFLWDKNGYSFSQSVSPSGLLKEFTEIENLLGENLEAIK